MDNQLDQLTIAAEKAADAKRAADAALEAKQARISRAINTACLEADHAKGLTSLGTKSPAALSGASGLFTSAARRLQALGADQVI